jgi:hypothetical protein
VSDQSLCNPIAYRFDEFGVIAAALRQPINGASGGSVSV